MGLNQFLACSLEDNEKQALTDVVNDAVQRLNDLSCEASRMLNGFCIWLLENNHAFSDIRYADAPYRFKSQKNELLNKYMNDVYSKIRDPKLAYCDASGLSSIVNSIAKEYATNALNHVQINIVRFTRQYVDFILSREVGPELTRKTYNQVKQFILAELERNSSDSNLKRFPFEALMVIKKKKLVKRPQSEHDALFASIIKIWDTARDVLQCRNLTKSVVKNEWWLYIPSMYHMLKIWDTARDVLQCRNLTKSVVKNEWWLYIPSMYQMLKVVCANYKEIAEERQKSRKRGRALRLYYLVPLYHYQQRHIPIDSSGLHEIMSLAKLHGKFDSLKRDDQRHIPIDSSGLHEIMSLAKLHGKFDSLKRDDVYDNPDLYWRSFFELRKVETFCDGYKVEVADYQLILTKTKVPSRWFGYHITTDGVQVGISVLKPLNEATVNEWGVEEKEVFHHLEGTPITITVAFDPGRRNLLDAVAGDNESKEFMKCTCIRWREISGAKHEVADYQLILPKTKVPSRRFGYHITTDGVQVGISVLKPLSEAKVNEWGLDDEEVFHPLPMNSETRIVAIDPGRRNLYDAVAGDEVFREVPSRWFGYHITTDGVQVGISVLKPLNEATVNEWGVEEKEVFHHLEGTPITITVAFDPGRRNLLDAVAGDNESKEFMKCTCIRWREISGAKHGLQKRSHWMSLNKDIVKILTNGPSPKCCNTETYKTFLKQPPKLRRLRFKTRITRQKAYDVVSKELAVLMKTLTNGPSPKCCNTETYNTFLKHFVQFRMRPWAFRPPKLRRLRFKTRITRQKAYDVVSKELTGGDSNCIIAYGAGKFNCSSKGHASTPNKHRFVELRKECRTRLVPE
ncbi:hypothetical protein MP638_003067 [Amoeboaphelidium occidentale]|nr:hypothetical protein MP638_003067 [Amoeboaphelidium occidentale]